MTGMTIERENDRDYLIFEGDLDGKTEIDERLGLRVTCSDGSVFHWRKIDGHWGARMLRRGNLFELVSVGKTEDVVMFLKGLHWAFACVRFYDFIEDKEKRERRGELIRAAKNMEIL